MKNIYNDFVEKVSRREHPYVIAEIGINHNGDMILAKEMIDAAVENGADCVKFQSFQAEKYISVKAEKAEYQMTAEYSTLSQQEIIKATEVSQTQLADLMAYSTKLEVDFLSTPFEVWSLRSLVQLGLPAIKVSSCNLTNLPFLRELAASGVPALISTGMASLHEVITAVQIFKETQSPLLVFQCVSNYPASVENANLKVINAYSSLFNCPVGFSDHTEGNIASIVAVSLGACAVEKHFTISRKLPGIDQKASIEPSELRELVNSLRLAKASLGSPLKCRTEEEQSTSRALRRSLVAARDIEVGEVFSDDVYDIMRPGGGLEPEFATSLVGKRFTASVEKGQVLTLDDFLIQ